MADLKQDPKFPFGRGFQYYTFGNLCTSVVCPLSDVSPSSGSNKSQLLSGSPKMACLELPQPWQPPPLRSSIARIAKSTALHLPGESMYPDITPQLLRF